MFGQQRPVGQLTDELSQLSVRHEARVLPLRETALEALGVCKNNNIVYITPAVDTKNSSPNLIQDLSIYKHVMICVLVYIRWERMKNTNNHGHSTEEFKFEMEEFNSDDSPLQTLWPVSHSLILLRWSNSCHVITHGL